MPDSFDSIPPSFFTTLCLRFVFVSNSLSYICSSENFGSMINGKPISKVNFYFLFIRNTFYSSLSTHIMSAQNFLLCVNRQHRTPCFVLIDSSELLALCYSRFVLLGFVEWRFSFLLMNNCWIGMLCVRIRGSWHGHYLVGHGFFAKESRWSNCLVNFSLVITPPCIREYLVVCHKCTRVQQWPG